MERQRLQINNQSGQSLVEILVSMAVLVLFVFSLATLFYIMFSVSLKDPERQTATLLLKKANDYLDTISDSGWSDSIAANTGTLYLIPKVSGAGFDLVSTPTSTKYDGSDYYIKLDLSSKGRDGNNNVLVSGGTDDTSLKGAVLSVASGTTSNDVVNIVRTVSRNDSEVFHQTDWSGVATTNSVVAGSEGGNYGSVDATHLVLVNGSIKVK